jgi:aspartate/tyrosine/aromatic aminotransferase
MPFFETLELLPQDPLFSIPILFAADSRPYKVNLGIGAYRNAEGKPKVLDTVKKAEQRLLEKGQNKEYLPIDGDPEFRNALLPIIFGEKIMQADEGEVFAAQSVGGTGALRVLSEFLYKVSNKKIFVSDPTWDNHKRIFKHAGFEVETYPYFRCDTRSVDFEGMCRAIEKMPAKSVILLHACCHNPTGVDLTIDQWKKIADLLKKKQIIPFFDLAYQGFGRGVEEDAQPVRLFVKEGLEVFIAYSCAKNFGMYCERLGLLVYRGDKESTKRVASHLKQIIRGMYSNPPAHGARIVAEILQDAELKKEWLHELNAMRARIEEIRSAFVEGLTAKNGYDFAFIKNQKGMFSYTCLTSEQVQKLKEEYALYMPADGRINVAGLNFQNLDYVVDALSYVVKK